MYTKEEKLLALDLVRESGINLRICAEHLRNDYDIALAAVTQNGCALQYVSDELKNNRTIVLAAVNKWGFSLQYASTNLRNDREIVLAALEEYPLALKDVGNNLAYDKDIVFTALYHDYNVLEYIVPCLQNDPVVKFLNRRKLPILREDWPLVKKALIEKPDYFINPDSYIRALTSDMEYPYLILAQYALSKDIVLESEAYPEIE